MKPSQTDLPKFDLRMTWIGLGLLTLLLTWLTRLNPGFTELLYSRGLYVMIRWVWDYSLGLLPFPVLYLAITALCIYFFIKLRKALVNYRRVAWRYRLGSFIYSSLAFAGAALFFFQWLWGFNYNRVSLAKQLSLPEVQPDTSYLKSETLWATQHLISSRMQIPVDTTLTLSANDFPHDVATQIRRSYINVLDSLGYPCPGRARVRKVYPKGALLRNGASGIFIPYVGEGHVDAALTDVSRAFTLAHEMAHVYGIGDEGSANFLAYLATETSENPALQYSGRLMYWRYLMGALRQTDTLAFRAVYRSLPKGIKEDLRLSREAVQRYPAFFPVLFDRLYDSYLKSQGIRSGSLSYDEFVSLVAAWKQKKKITG